MHHLVRGEVHLLESGEGADTGLSDGGTVHLVVEEVELLKLNAFAQLLG